MSKNPNHEIYSYPPEQWSEAKCARLAKSHYADSYGTRMQRAGYIGCDFGETRYNGGTVIEGKWYAGITRPLPDVPDTVEIYHVSTWGYFIRKAVSK